MTDDLFLIFIIILFIEFDKIFLTVSAGPFYYVFCTKSTILQRAAALQLPPEMQQRLLSLPGDLARRLISRATARTIRRIFL